MRTRPMDRRLARAITIAIALVAAGAAAPPTARAAPGDVLSSFPAPAAAPYGLAWDGTNLWVAVDGPEMIFQVTPDGTVVSSFPAPAGGIAGLTWDGSALWLADFENALIYRLSTTGTVLATIPSPGGSPQGLTWDGSQLWHHDKSGSDRRVYQLTTAGTVLSSFTAPGTNGRGLAWDGVRLWIVDRGTDLLYELSTTGTVLSTLGTPCPNARGLTHDGTDFWIVCGDAIYQVEGRTVPPATLSIVKRAFLLDGTPLSTGISVPRGTAVRFLLYVSNPGALRSDVSLRDPLDAAFVYQPGTLLYDTASPACASGNCSAAEEAAILAAATAGTPATDATDADPISFVSGAVEAGDQNVANATLDVPGGSTFALAFTVRIQ